MARRCGCAGSVCSCFVTGTGNATVTGSGSEADPYVVDVDAAVITVTDTATLDLVLTGAGTPASPYVLSGNVIGGGGGGLTTEQIMDYLGSVTTPAEGLKGGTNITVTYNDAGNTITIANTVNPLLRSNHTGQVSLRTVGSDWMVGGNPTVIGTSAVPVVPNWDGDSWEKLTLDRFPTKDTAGGGLNGLSRQFADIPDTPLADGEVWVGPPSGVTLLPAQIGGILDSFDNATLRFLASAMAKYRPAIHILDPGEIVPADTDLPYLVFRKTAAPSLVPTLMDPDGTFAQATNTMTAVSGPAVTPAGTVVCLVIGASGEATTPVEWTMAWASGVCPFTNRSRGLSAGNAEVTIYEGVVTTDIPANTNLVLTSKLPDGTTNQNRVHQMASLLTLPNVDSTTPFDQQQNGSGGSSGVLDKTLTFGSPTPVPNEIIVVALCNNYGTGTVTRPTFGVAPVQDLQSVLSSSASARNLWVGYTILSAVETNAAVTAHIDASDGATGGWAMAAAGFRGV